MDDDEEEDSAVEEGKIPNYTRGMLKMQVGDGRRSIKAMEYKKIEDLVLGNTMLGCKVGCIVLFGLTVRYWSRMLGF